MHAHTQPQSDWSIYCRGLANKLPDKLIIKRHIPMGANAHTYIFTHQIIRHPCDHIHTHTLSRKHSHPPTGTCGQPWPGPQSRQEAEKKRIEKRGREKGSRKREVLDVLTPFLEPSLSNDGDIAHGSFTPSLMPLHACSTERERGRRGGEEERREREGEEERRRGGQALPASASLSLPSFPVHPLVRAVSLSDAHTNTHCVCVRVCVVLLPVVAYLPVSLPSSSSPPPPPPPPPPLSFPLQTFLLTSSDSAWKEVKGEKKNKEKRRHGFIFLFLCCSLSFPPKPFHAIWQDKQRVIVRTNAPSTLPPPNHAPSSSFCR